MELGEIIEDAQKRCQDGQVSLGKIIDGLVCDNGLGLLLLIPALIILLPLSIIPGISSLCALIAFISAYHIFFGHSAIWLPERIRNIPVNGHKIAGRLNVIRHFLEKIDGYTKPRFTFMTSSTMQKLTSAMGMALTSATLIFGFLPFIDIALMAPVACFGLGICRQDGLIIGMGWILLAFFLCITALLMK